MAWESDLLSCCKRLKEAAEGLSSGIEKLAAATNLPLPDDINSKQLSALYRLGHELTRADTPPASIVGHPQLMTLKSNLNER